MSSPRALVTGASRGIGEEIARALANRGYRVILTARSGKRLSEVRDSLKNPSIHHIVVADLTVDEELSRVVATTRENDEPLDLLVLNAGMASTQSVEETSIEQWDQMMGINLRAPFLLVRGLLPLLRRSHGTIVAIGSVVSTASYKHLAAYVASKHGLNGFIKALAKEVHPDVRVHSIFPGGVATELVTIVRPDIDSRDLIQPRAVAGALATLLDLPPSAAIDEIRLRRWGKEPWQQD